VSLGLFSIAIKSQILMQLSLRLNNKGFMLDGQIPALRFGSMPTHQESVSCCAGFSKKYKHIVDQTYEKADRSIYEKLCKFGNENTAISIAETKYAEYKNQCITLPSKMCPCTTVHILVKELKGKVSQ